MDNIWQERPNKDPILNVKKQEIWWYLNITFGTHVEKFMVFKTFKNKLCFIPRNKVISAKPS